MNKTDPYWSATLAAERVVKERAISALPIDRLEDQTLGRWGASSIN